MTEMMRVRHIALALLISLMSWSPVLAQTTANDRTNTDGQNAKVATCSKAALGEKYSDIISNKIQPDDLSEAELEAVEACFSQNAPTVSEGQKTNPQPGDFSKMAPQTKACLEKKLGSDWQTKLASVKSSKESKGLGIQSCFGAITLKGGPGQDGPGQPPTGGIPEEVKSCVIKTVGQVAANEIFAGQLPEEAVASQIEAANCFKSFGPPRGDNGKAPQMSAESQACFQKVTGTTPETKPRLTKSQLEQLNKECFKGGQGGPGNPGANGPATLPENIKSCFASSGLDVGLLTKGPELLTDAQKQQVGDCFQKNNFTPQGPGGPGGQRGPGGPAGNQPNLPDEVKKCIEGIMGSLSADKQPTEEQKQRVGQECFKGGPGGQGGPNRPGQGGPNGQGGPGGPQLPDDKRACVEKIAGKTDPSQLSEEIKRQVQKECFGGIGGGVAGPQGPGGPNNPNPDPGQPGQPGQPAPNGPQGVNLPPHILQCAKDKGLNLDNLNDETVRRKLNELCPQGAPGQPGQPAQSGPANQQGGQVPPPNNPGSQPPGGQPGAPAQPGPQGPPPGGPGGQLQPPPPIKN